MMADNVTTLHIDRVAILDVEFIDRNEVLHSATVNFPVFDMTNNDAIIGLPDIVNSFHKLFIDMLSDAVDSIPIDNDTKVHDDNNTYFGNININIENVDIAATTPWASISNDTAPEDYDTPLPSSFPDYLHYMEMSVEEAMKEYLSLIDTHISSGFSANTDIRKFLTDVGYKAFVPQNWEGINGIEPLNLEFNKDMPTYMKPKARPVNPRLFQHAKTEFDRLLLYLYEISTSNIASCLVIAPKATAPFIRFCGDYAWLNKFINIGHYPIPHVFRNLEKICKFKIFLDFDMANSFHQIRLSKHTSAMLSVQTPWGQVQPKFLPEGVGPASGILQKIVHDIFDDFDEWTIRIFDNLLILAHDYDDAYKKTVLFVNRCIDRNVILKFSKTWLGFDEANFFGYVCKYQKFELSQKRKDAIAAIPFPTSKKSMQSFLGTALFFKSFMPHYSTLTAQLNDMVHNNFDWINKQSWVHDYESIFNNFKIALQDACALHYPDYDLEWILRTDASMYGVAAVLLMRRKNDDDTYTLLPIAFASSKFSQTATNWTTIEQECYGIYFGIKEFSYYLHCKSFILETDHNNLLWIEASLVPKIIRWRIYMQSFTFLLRHIPGKLNKIADYLSRIHNIDITTVTQNLYTLLYDILETSVQIENDDTYNLNNIYDNTDNNIVTESSNLSNKMTYTEALSQIHGGRMGHLGARGTWQALNKYFPGHRIPYLVVADYVATCGICQKLRLNMNDSIKPVVRHIKPLYRRAVVGVDTLTITPEDTLGNQYLIVMVNHHTKHAVGYPAKSKDAVTMATALFVYFCTYGMFDSIISDPGSDLMSEVVNQLNKYLGIRHTVSLVDRHESNGVEGTNARIIRHLKALIHDERVKSIWSSPTILPLVFFIINSTDSSETGVIPFHAHFGSQDSTYFRMPAGLNDSDITHEYVKLLDENLCMLNDISIKYQSALILERTKSTPADTQNQYQPGDLVLFQLNPNDPLPTKLSPKFTGPFKVVKQTKNDVDCQSLIYGSISSFHVERLKIFHGTIDEAKALAQLDNDQYVIECFKAYRGYPVVRTTMEFEVKFADGSISWLPWSTDIFATVQYEDYCRKHPQLYPLIYSAKDATKEMKSLNNTAIEIVKPGDTVYVDIRSYNYLWYNSMNLPDSDHICYVVSYYYVKYAANNKKKIVAKCAVFDETYTVDHFFVRSYGAVKDFNSSYMVLIDKKFVLQYPLLLPDDKRDILIEKYKV